MVERKQSKTKQMETEIMSGTRTNEARVKQTSKKWSQKQGQQLKPLSHSLSFSLKLLSLLTLSLLTLSLVFFICSWHSSGNQ